MGSCSDFIYVLRQRLDIQIVEKFRKIYLKAFTSKTVTLAEAVSPFLIFYAPLPYYQLFLLTLIVFRTSEPLLTSKT